MNDFEWNFEDDAPDLSEDAELVGFRVKLPETRFLSVFAEVGVLFDRVHKVSRSEWRGSMLDRDFNRKQKDHDDARKLNISYDALIRHRKLD